jgi:hypothetical protein
MENITLANFLVKAKTNCYGSINDIQKTILPDGGTELNYKENLLSYRDRYYGGEPYIGEEVVLYKDEVIWAMNFRGKVVNVDALPVEKVYSFIREAIKMMSPDNPYRGPSHYQSDLLHYYSEVTGTLEHFNGKEKIILKDELIYEGFYHGGYVGRK